MGVVKRIVEFSDRHNFQIIVWTGLVAGPLFGAATWLWLQPQNGSVGRLLFDVVILGAAAALVVMLGLAIVLVLLTSVLEAIVGAQDKRRSNKSVR
jgi:hypothetical protein